MAYLGTSPNTGENRKLDDISGSFNGSTTTFNLQVDSTDIYPGTTTALLISVGGVIQEPITAYSLHSSGKQVTFSTAPDTGEDFFGVALGQAIDITTPADDSVLTAKIADRAVTQAKLAESSVGGSKVRANVLSSGSIYTANIAGNVSLGRGLAVGYTDGRVPQANLDVNGNTYISGATRIGGNLNFSDDDAILMGDSNDLKIFHNGSHSQINDLSAGNLQLLSNGAGVDIMKTDGEYMGRFYTDDRVELFHDSDLKLSTDAKGVSANGNVSVTRSLAVGYTDGKMIPAANLDVTGNAVISGSSYPNAGAVGPLWTGRNWIINGTGRINQRFGTTAATTINAYAMDRWRTYGGALGYELKSESEARTVADSSPDGYYISFRRTDSVTNNTGIVNGIETKNSKQFAGRTAYLSFKARKGANFSSSSDLLGCSIRSGEGTDENPISMTNMATTTKNVTLTTTWQKFFVTVDIATDKTQLSVDFNYTPVGTVGADDSYDLTEVQLEIGSEPTPFEQVDYETELTRCKRYYQFIGGDTAYQSIVNATYFGAGDAVGKFTHQVELRGNPTVAKSGSWSVLGGGGTVSQTVSGDQNGPKTIQLGFTGGSGGTSGEATTIRVSNDSAFRLSFDAEL